MLLKLIRMVNELNDEIERSEVQGLSRTLHHRSLVRKRKALRQALKRFGKIEGREARENAKIK